MNQDMAFIEYHNDNPDIFRQFLRFSLEMKSAGRKVIGAKMIAERIRWETITRGGEDYKIQNSFVSYYARLLMYKIPSLRGCFRLKRADVDGTTTDLEDVKTWDHNYWQLCQ